VRLFHDVSFSIGAGELVALRGPNGSGKTTMLRCVAGLTRPDSGDVLWDGTPTRSGAQAFHADLLFAGHLPGIKDDLNAEENVGYALRLRGRPIDPAAVRRSLAEVGLEKRRFLPARRLSAGQRRRIGLARLALDGAALWLLDEPLTALDDAGQHLLADLLGRHVARGGLALVATHHDLPPGAGAMREWRMGE